MSAVVLALSLFNGSASAQQTVEQSALALAPEDAAFFSTSLNMRASYDEFIGGTLVERLLAVPFVNRVKTELTEQWENPPDDFRQAKMIFESPAVLEILKLAIDMSSNEFFVYGGNDWCESIEGMVAIQEEMSSLSGQGPEEIMQYLKDLDPEDFANIRIPTTVIGFKLTDDDIARNQLDALEGIIRIALSNVDELRPIMSKLKRDDFKGGQSLSLTLDASMIPRVELEAEQQEAFDKMMELLEGRSVSLAIGLKDQRLLITFGESAEILEEVGTNTSSLLDNETLQTLTEEAPVELRSIGYVSKRFRESQWQANFGNYFTRLSGQFAGALDPLIENDPKLQQWREDIATDAEWLDQQISELAPEFGDALSWSYAIDNGLEGKTYDWSENVALENANPLSIMEHSGENVLFTVGLKQRSAPGAEALVEYLLERVPVHAQQFLTLVEDDEEDRAKAMLAFEKGWPLLQDVFAAIRDKIAPALSDGEAVFSLSADWKTRELGPDLPRAAVALPLPEMAWAFKLNDRDMFIDGCVDIFAVIDQLVDLVREIEPNSVPAGYRVPRPDEEALADGTRYFYSLLSNLVPLEGFEPQLLVGDDTIVLGYSVRQVDDMLQAGEPVRPAWLESDTPVAAISYVNFARLISMVKPWASYGFSLSGIGMDTPLADDRGPVPTPNDVLQIWSALTELGEAYSSTSIDDGVTITRWQWVGPQ